MNELDTMKTQNHNGTKIHLIDKSLVDIIKEAVHPKPPDEPFYICNLGELVRKYEEWIECLPRVKPYYAVKCNYNELVLKTLAALGTGFDCASKAEMTKVIDLGVSPSKIIFANPAKLTSHILAAAQFDVQVITFDNAVELHKMKSLYRDARLLVRIRCDAAKAQCPLGVKFGAMIEDVPKLLAVASELGLNVVGVSFHVGSGCGDVDAYARALEKVSWVFNIGNTFGFQMNMVDIGGGFLGNEGTSIAEVSRVINASLDEYFPEGCGVELIAEPGRFFVASAFTLVTQVHSIREIEDYTSEDHEVDRRFMYYINDGIYGSFNCVVYDHAVVTPRTLKKVGVDEKLYTASIWGPTCDGLDQVCPKANLPELTVGDCIYFNDMGAYTLVAAGTFNGFPVPKVYYFSTVENWMVLQQLNANKNLYIENVPVYMKAVVGCNRDAVGWAGPTQISNNICSTFSV